MTYLELCQRLVQKAGISGTMVSVTGQVGELGRVTNWIVDAYEYLLNKHSDWKFLRARVQFDASIGKARYTAADAGITDFGEWRFINTWRAFSTAAGVADEQPLAYMEYDRFRDTYLIGTSQLMTGRPMVVTEAPNQSLVLWPIPDQAYTIVGEQYRAPAMLAANTDVPVFAARFHNAIVQRALMFYGEYEGDPNTFGAGQTECARIVSMMEGFYLPEWETTGPMA